MLVPMVDVVFADVAQPDQARIIAMNAHMFCKIGGHIVISIKVFFFWEKYCYNIKKNKIEIYINLCFVN